MSYRENRELSPNTEDKDNDSGFGISKIFNFLKSKLYPYKQQKQRRNQVPSAGQQDLSNIEADPLVNNFQSTRKRTLSLQSLHNQNNGVVPRSSTLNSNFGMYTNYYDALKNENEVLDNDLERRMSTEYGSNIRKESIAHIPNGSEVRDDSPMADIIAPRASILEDNKSIEEPEDMPIIIEHEFAPLYKDSNGNLVRPPFINLDPRERYHVLQLKKSIQASEALQNRIKYMINPNETHSKPLINTNKVETSTQTHDSDYLENSLNFSSLKRRLLIKKQTNKNKRAKNSSGYFIGEFLYDDTESKNGKSKDKLRGYLGDVNKPQFNQESTKKNATPVSIQPGKDESQIFNRFSNQNVKSTDNRIGLDDSLLKNEKVNVALDSDYVVKTDKISDLIKVKKNNVNAPKEKEAIPPSSGFKFSINSNDINSILDKKHEDDTLIHKSNKLLTKDIDGKAPSFSFDISKQPSTELDNKSENQKPLFSFKPSNKDVSKVNQEEGPEPTLKRKASHKDEPQPSFSFGNSEAKGENKPLFSFGTSAEKKDSDKPAFSFGAPSDKKETSKPNFSFGVKGDSSVPKFSSVEATESKEDKNQSSSAFGASNGKDDTSKPAFTFDNSTKKSEGASKPSVIFGSSSEKKEESSNPTFTFGGSSEKKSDASTPAFTFGTSSGSNESSKPTNTIDGPSGDSTPKPVFTFGASGEKKDDAPKPALSFGNSAEKKDDISKPAFTFGASTDKKDDTAKPSFTFGAPSDKKDDATKPAFTFGASSEKKEDSPKPSLSFGASAEKKDDISKPAFTFGASTDKKDDATKPSFTFGASSEKKDNSKPNFTFGAPAADATPKPTFSFGVTSEKMDAPAPFSFGGAPAFGASGQNKDSTPKPVENPTGAFGSGSATPNFSFGGSKDSTPKPAFSFASGSGANTNTQPTNAGPTNNLFNFTGTLSKEGTPDPATIFGGAMNPVNPNNNNGMNGFHRSAESSPFGFNAQKNTPDFKFANGIQPQFPSGLPTTDMNNNFGLSSVMTPPTLSTTPPIIKSNRKIAQMRLRRR